MANIFKSPCDEAEIRTRAAVAPCARRAGRWVLAATILGSSMVFIDGTVVNVALPALQSNLNATVVDVQWVVESYGLLLASLLLVGGSLGDRFGRKIVYVIGIGIFAAASALCGLAQNINHLIAARALQGIGGALLVPVSLAIISASFAEEDRGKAIGAWSAFTSITAAIGPILGGWLIEHISWRAAFFINLPIAALVFAITSWRVPESRDLSKHESVDWAGAGLGTIGLGGLVYGLVESSNLGFSNSRVIFAITGGSAILAMFLLAEARSRDPMLPLSLFRSKTFSGANLLTFLLYAALSGGLFFLPLNLIQVQGYPPTAAGAAFLPFILIMFLLSRWSGGLITRYGARLPLVVGPVIAALGFSLFMLPGVGGSYWTHFFPALVVLGLGMAISVAPLTTAVMNSIDENQAGIASGTNNAVSRTAGVLSVAVLGVVMLHAYDGSLSRRLTEIGVAENLRHEFERQHTKLAAVEIPEGLGRDVRESLESAIDASFVSAFRLIMGIAAALALTGALGAWITIGTGRESNRSGLHGPNRLGAR